jgi:hypothetical protein
MPSKRRIRTRTGAAAVIAVASVAGATVAVRDASGTATVADASATTGQTLFYDNFSSGFNTSSTWLLAPAATPNGVLPQGDGIATTTPGSGLTVVPTGTNPTTGAPAFAATTGQGGSYGAGTADHLKWVAQPLKTAGTGFAVPSTGSLNCTSEMSATTEGVAQNPFGTAAVPSSQSDPRLANATLITLDPDNETTADFAVANTEIWAIYERLPAAGSTAASYQYLIPVASSAPGQLHTLQVTYSDGGNRVTWLVNGRSVLSTDQIGTLAFGRTYLATDHGGTPGQVTDQNVQCGLALGDDLDAGGPPGDPKREGLVELDSDPDFYYAPQVGQPTPQTFIDDQSLLGDRLWGQGVTLHDSYFEVSTSQ